MASQEDRLNQLASRIDELTTIIEGLQARINDLEKAPSYSMIENLVKQKLKNPTFHQDTLTVHPNLSSKLPKEFSANDLPIFKPTDDPRYHLKGFRATMALKGIEPALFHNVFPLSLEPVCQKWFYSLSEKETSTWEDIAHAFITRYKGNIQVQTSIRELEILRQGEEEGFTAYLTRWKQAAAQMVTTPAEPEMVKTFISGLQPAYSDHLKYLGLNTFEKVYHIGVDIEDDLLSGDAL